MKVSGIICEYNPFHNGHLYHIEQTRKNGATHIVAVMSGNFVQRGDVAIMDKLTRSRLAVKSGVDLVIELPVQYSLAAAEEFASAAVWLLNGLGAVDELSFGSECGDAETLLRAMRAADRIAAEKHDQIRDIMEKGYTYPRALTAVLSGEAPEEAAIISEPNNILAVEYLRALKALDSEIKPFTIRRQGAGHDSGVVSDGFSSASGIRERILSGNPFDPAECTVPVWADAITDAVKSGKIASLSRLERVILYRVRTAPEYEIARTSGVGQGLENRIASSKMAESLDELLFTIKTKRYTMARVRRVLLALLIGITSEDMTHMPPYGRILALNEHGREILARAKGRATLPYAVSLARLGQANSSARRFAELEGRASDIYGLAMEHMTSAGDDFRAKIMIDME